MMTHLAMRPFGREEKDLDINFEAYPSPYLVTEVIMTCLDEQGESAQSQEKIWDMTVGERIEALLEITALTTGGVFILVLDCSNKDCGQAIEIELTKDELSELQRGAKDNTTINIKLGKRQVTFRKPTGRDQLDWLRIPYGHEEDVIRDMIASLIVPKNDTKRLKELSGEEIALVEHAIQRADPLIGFEVASECPYCKQYLSCELDLQTLALKRLRSVQQRQLRDIHLLAKHYHWTEQEITALPAWRRSEYLSYLKQERGG